MFSKKLISILLTLAVALSAAACGNNTVPKAPNEPEIKDIPEENMPHDYSVRVSELMAKNRATLTDEDGDYSDWIELQNYGSESVSVKGLYLSDKSGSMGWQLPETELGAGEFLTVFASGKNRTDDILHTDFSLSEGEMVYLKNSYGEELSALECVTDTADVSVMQSENGAVTSIYPTPGSNNTIEAYIARQEQSSCPGPLVINEACTYNTRVYFVGFDTIDKDDWAEIRNVSSEPVLLSDYYLSDDRNDLFLMQLPDEMLAPGAVRVILLNDESFGLDSESDRLYLSDKNGASLDVMPLVSIPAGCSFGRMEGENGFFYFADPTPDERNGYGCRYIAEAPVCLTKDGVYNGVDSVTVELSGKGRIFYTTDGTLPTAESMEYTGPFDVSRTTPVRAVCVENGAINSRAASYNFIINENHTLPVVALNFDRRNEFGYIWYEQMKADEIACNLAFYEDDGSFSINAGMKLNGETSLILPKKNMSLRFRGCYGDATLKYDLYDGGAAEFQNLLLRAGQDYYNTVFRNELCQELCNEFSDNVISQRSRFVNLYINGEYFGVYTIKEKTNEAHYAFMTGTAVESAEALEANIYANTDLYQNVLGYAMEHDMTQPEYYDELCKHLDVDSLIDWLIAEGMCANNDLASGNLRYVSSSELGNQWKLMFYDLDATFADPELIFKNVLGADRIYQQVTVLSRALVKNPDFRDRFLTRAAEAIKTVYSNESILNEIDRLTAEIEPEIGRDFDLRFRSIDSWYGNIKLLKRLITENDWENYAIKNLKELLNLTPLEIERYFG